MCCISPGKVCHPTAHYTICKKEVLWADTNDADSRGTHTYKTESEALETASRRLGPTGKGGKECADTTDEAGTHTAGLKAQEGNRFYLYPPGTKCAPHLN